LALGPIFLCALCVLCGSDLVLLLPVAYSVSFVSSVLLPFKIFAAHDDFHQFHSPGGIFLAILCVLGCSPVLILYLLLTLFSHLLFSVSPRLRVSVVILGFGCGSATLWYKAFCLLLLFSQTSFILRRVVEIAYARGE